jgi:hypothetical protein
LALVRETASRNNLFYPNGKWVKCKQKILVDAFLADILLGKDGGIRVNKKQW